MNKNYLAGAIGVFSGLYILFLGLGFIPVDAQSIHAPLWLIDIIGLMLIVAGLSALAARFVVGRTTDLFGALVLLGFSLVAGWIAFGPGARVFGGAGPLLGRIVFGVATNFCVLFTLWALKRAIVNEQSAPIKEKSTVSLWVVCALLAAVALEVGILAMFTNKDGTLRLWEMATSAVEQTQQAREYSRQAPLSPNGTAVVTPSSVLGGEEKKISSFRIKKIWDHEFMQPRALAVDMDDNVYVSETYQGTGTHSRILKFNNNGVLLGWWGKGGATSGWHAATSTEQNVGNGNKPGEFNYIFKITFDPNGNMYVVDRSKYYDTSGSWHVGGSDRIQRFNRDGSYSAQLDNEYVGWHTEDKTAFSNSSGPQFLLDEPSCIIATKEEFIVGSWTKNRVDKFDIYTGAPIGWLGKSKDGSYGWHHDGESVSAPYWGTEVGAFNGVIDCRLYKDNLYVVSYASNPVVAIFNNLTGSYIGGLSHNQGHKPQEIIVDKFGNLIFSDNYEGSIKFMDQTLTLQDKMQLGPGGDYFGVGDFALNSAGVLYFVEQQKQKIYEIELSYK